MKSVLPKRYRGLELAVVVPDADHIPESEEEFVALVDSQKQGWDEETSAYALWLWMSGALVVWVSSTSQWASKDGPISHDDAQDAFRVAAERNRRGVVALTDRLRLGGIAPDQWYTEMKEMVEESHRWAFLMVAGPLWLLNAQLRAIYEGAVSRELAFLARLFSDMMSGKQRLDGSLLRRIALYASHARGTMYDIWRWVGGNMLGYTHERNVLGAAEHCAGCLAETARGIVPIGALVPIGDRDCLSNCKCRIELVRLES